MGFGRGGAARAVAAAAAPPPHESCSPPSRLLLPLRIRIFLLPLFLPLGGCRRRHRTAQQEGAARAAALATAAAALAALQLAMVKPREPPRANRRRRHRRHGCRSYSVTCVLMVYLHTSATSSPGGTRFPACPLPPPTSPPTLLTPRLSPTHRGRLKSSASVGVSVWCVEVAGMLGRGGRGCSVPPRGRRECAVLYSASNRRKDLFDFLDRRKSPHRYIVRVLTLSVLCTTARAAHALPPAALRSQRAGDNVAPLSPIRRQRRTVSRTPATQVCPRNGGPLVAFGHIPSLGRRG